MRRRRLNPGRLIGQVIGWVCLVSGILEAVTGHRLAAWAAGGRPPWS